MFRFSHRPRFFPALRSNGHSILQKEAFNLLVPDPVIRPEKFGDFFYYQRLDENGSRVFCRVPVGFARIGSAEEEEEILNTKNSSVDIIKLNEDSEILGYVADFSGSEDFVFLAKDVSRDLHFPWQINNVWNFEFLREKGARGEIRAIFTIFDDKTKRPFKAVLGEFSNNSFALDSVIAESHCPSAYLDVSRSKNGEWIFISSNTRGS